MRLVLGVEEITNQRLEISAFLIQPTFSGLCQAVRERMSRHEFQPVLTLRKHGTRLPLFCLYNYNGDINAYFGLAEALGDDQPVFGIRSPALEDPSRLPSSIEAAAAGVLDSIRKIQPRSLALVGYSWAGVLAFEVARQFHQKGGLSCFVAMVGADAPVPPASVGSRFARFVWNFPAWVWQVMTDRENRPERISRWKKMVRRNKPNPAVIAPPSTPEWVSTPTERHLFALTEKYRPQPDSNVAVDLFRERESYEPQIPHPLYASKTSSLPDGGWNRLTRKQTRIHWLEGDHLTIVRPPAVFDLARSIRQAMDRHIKRLT